MSLAAQAIRGTLFVLAGAYTAMAVNFLANMILARLLAPEDFGLVTLAVFFFSVLDVTSKLNLDYALIHRRDVSDQVLTTHFTLSTLAGIATIGVAGIGMLLLPVFGYAPVVGQVLWVIAWFSSLQAAGATSRILLDKELRFGRVAAINTAALLLSWVVAIHLALNGWGLWSLVAGNVANITLTTIGMILFSYWRPGLSQLRLDRATAGWFLRYGLSMTPGTMATLALLQFDNFLVGTIAGAAALGYYGQAYKLAQIPLGLVTHIAAKVSLPLYAKVQADRERLSRAFQITLELIVALALPLSLIIFVAAPELVVFFFTEKWLPSAVLLRALVGYSVIRPISDDVNSLFVAVGRPGRVSLVIGIEAISLIALGIPFTLVGGALGTALAVNAAFVIGLVVAYASVGRSVDLNYRQAFGAPLVGVLAGLLAWGLLLRDEPWTASVFVRLVAKAALAGGVYLAVIVTLEGRRLRERLAYAWQLLRGNQ